jgi:hypothetical protein
VNSIVLLQEEAQYEAQANFVVPAAGTTRSYVCNLGDVPRVVSWGFFHPSLFIVRRLVQALLYGEE